MNTLLREPHQLKGLTVKLKSYDNYLNGRHFILEDWWLNIGGPWQLSSTGTCGRYAQRIETCGLPIDDEVIYGKVGGYGFLVHVSEIAERVGH